MSIASLLTVPAPGPQPSHSRLTSIISHIPGPRLVNRFFPETQRSFGFDEPERPELGWIQTDSPLGVIVLASTGCGAVMGRAVEAAFSPSVNPLTSSAA